MLEERKLLSGTLKTVAVFNGSNGFSPAAVVEDANRNLFGITMFIDTGAPNDQSGKIFEVPAGTNTINVLAKSDNSAQIISPVSRVIDSSGNLFGTENGDPLGGGKVFELAAGSSTITTVASFPAPPTVAAVGSQGKLTAIDSAGDLFGFDDLGNPFEVVKDSGAVSSLADVAQTLGPVRDLRLGADGNLYAVTGSEKVLQIALPTKAVTTLATLDPATTGSQPIGITLDPAGNVWGFS